MKEIIPRLKLFRILDTDHTFQTDDHFQFYQKTSSTLQIHKNPEKIRLCKRQQQKSKKA